MDGCQFLGCGKTINEMLSKEKRRVDHQHCHPRPRWTMKRLAAAVYGRSPRQSETNSWGRRVAQYTKVIELFHGGVHVCFFPPPLPDTFSRLIICDGPSISRWSYSIILPTKGFFHWAPNPSSPKWDPHFRFLFKLSMRISPHPTSDWQLTGRNE